MGQTVIGFSLAFLDPIKRLILPKKWAAQQVHRSCLANFMNEGLQQTRDRTGILIYVSRLEHQVEILADQGIHSKTPDGYWQVQVKDLIDGIHQGNFSESMARVIEHIGDKLAENFPPRSDDTNELSNELRIGHSQRKKDDE